MNLLNAYLVKPSTRKALSKKPGQEGFSLIELVVVIAVLAVLTAIALPNFLGVSDDAAARSAQQAAITAFKECQVHKARGKSNATPIPKFESLTLGDFVIANNTSGTPTAATPAAQGSGTTLNCFDANGATLNIWASPKLSGKFPTYTVKNDGTKTCLSGASATYAKTWDTGCSGATASIGDWQ